MKKSLVMTTYNGEKYIIDQMESIRLQTCSLDEVLIFDDGSTDNTPELVERFIHDNNLSDWQFIVNQTNKGWRRNFMEGLYAASGDIIFLADQDDVWMPEKIELMSRAMEENDKIHLLVSEYQAFYDDAFPTVERKKVVMPEKKGIYSNIFNVLYPGCTYCARRELIYEAGRYWTEETAHDELLWRIALFSDALFVIPKKLIYWRRHQDSSWALEGSRNKTLEARIKWTEFAQNQISVIRGFLYSKEMLSEDKEKVLESNYKWLELRKQLFVKKSITSALKLILMKKYYNSFKQYLGDIYLTFFKR